MTLSDDDTVGVQNVVSNIAHEIGHAWGLYHEHQNPAFWASAYGGTKGTTFSAINWVCENLADYKDIQDKFDKMIADYPFGPELGESLYKRIREKLCFSRSVAMDYGFSAKEYLPLTVKDSYSVEKTDSESIDWDSIMLYPSGAGGILDASGNRAVPLRKPNGDPIPANLVPSQRDISGLVKLYGGPTTDETLLAANNNPSQQRFLEVRNADIGLSCSLG